MDLRAKLIPGVDGWIDGSFQLKLYRRDLTQELIQGDLPSHHEVHIAFGLFLSPSKRAVNKGKLNAFGKWCKGLLKCMEHSGGLGEQGMQLRKDWMSMVGAVKHLVFAVFSKDEACSSQRGELALDGSNASMDVPRELPNKEGSRLACHIEQPRTLPLCLTEKQIAKRAGICSHYENKCTQNENACQAGSILNLNR